MNGGLLIQIIRRKNNMKHYAYESPFKMKDKEGVEYTLEIINDNCPESPRSWDNLCTMVCWHRRYDLGDKHDFDDVDEFLVFSNTHDGSGAVKVACTPVRVCCQNTLNLALSTAKRSWTCKHMGKMEDKLWEATHTLQLANKYMEELRINAEKLAEVKISQDEVYQIVSEMFSVPESSSERVAANAQKAKTEFMVAYYMPDIKQFLGTGWGLVNAAADWASHASPQRYTSTYAERNFEKVVFGHPIFDKIVANCMARVGK
jgi:phage/plasmid-like protein (TIGR03299 family)